VYLKVVQKAACDFENESEEMQEHKFDAAIRTISRNRKCFQRSKKKLNIYVYLGQCRLQI
jgi:hypothetical protein